MKIQPHVSSVCTTPQTSATVEPGTTSPTAKADSFAKRPLFSIGFPGASTTATSPMSAGIEPPVVKANLQGSTYAVTPKQGESAHTTLSRLANKIRLAGYNVTVADDMMTVFDKHTHGPEKTQLIIDTDMALDDWPAILYIARHPNVDLRGITVTGAGEAHTVPGVNGAMKLLSLSGLEEQNLPVAGGRETPLTGNNVFPTQWRHEADTMFGLPLPKTKQAPTDVNAVDALIQMIESAPSKIDILTLGPLTNLALAIEQKPDLKDKVGMVTVMGGAVRVDGNLIVPGFTDDMTNNAAEWNMWIDPKAAKMVFESGLPITLVPLDATNSVQVTNGLLKTFEEHHDTPGANFVYEELKKNKGFIASGEFYLWDPAAAVVSANLDNPIGKVEELKIGMETTIGDFEGKTYESPEGSTMKVYTNADPETTFNEYLEVLTGEPGLYQTIRKHDAANPSAEPHHD